MVSAYLVFLAVLVAERIGELWISRRHAERAFARGALELGQAHFRWIQGLHALFFASCALEVVWLGRPFDPALAIPMVLATLAAQALRYWAIAALGFCWNVRVIVLPGAPVIATGPYRFVRHPNYLAVAIEGIAIPLVHGAWLTALGFTLLNAVLLGIRIRCEETGLALHCDYDARLGARPRFIPFSRTADSR